MSDNPLNEEIQNANPVYAGRTTMNPIVVQNVVQLIQQHALNVVWEQAYHCPCLDEQTGQPQPNCKVCHGQGWIYLHPRTIDMAIQGDNKNFSINPTGMDNLGTSKATPQITVNGYEQGIKPGDRITVTGWTTSESYTFNVNHERLIDGIFLPFKVASINEAYYIDNDELVSIDDINTAFTLDDSLLKINDDNLEGKVLTLSLEVVKRFYVVSMLRELRYQQYYKLRDKMWATGNGSGELLPNDDVKDETTQDNDSSINFESGNEIVDLSSAEAQSTTLSKLTKQSFPQVVNRDGAKIVLGKHQIFRMPPTLLIRRENLYFSNINMATSDGKNNAVVKDPTLNDFNSFLNGDD